MSWIQMAVGQLSGVPVPEVMVAQLDKANVGLVSVYDFTEFTMEKGLRTSCTLFLRLI